VQIIELRAKQQTKQTQSQRKTTTNKKTYEIKSKKYHTVRVLTFLIHGD
jgi:uncharacterized protein YdgA (DUF945 family)